MAVWDDFPLELQENILEHVVRCHHHVDSVDRQIARYATVCRGWKPFFEKYTVRNITVVPSLGSHEQLRPSPDLQHFRRLFGRQPERRNYVQHIMLYLGHNPLNQREHEALFARSVVMLLDILNSWDLPHKPWLTLELGVNLSELVETGRYDAYLDDGVLNTDKLQLGRVGGMLPGYDHKVLRWTTIKYQCQYMGVVNGQMKRAPLDPELLYWKHLSSQLGSTVIQPRPSVVRKLLIRLESLRNLSPKTVSQLLWSLPQLEHFHYERWRHELTDSANAWDWGVSYLLERAS